MFHGAGMPSEPLLTPLCGIGRGRPAARTPRRAHRRLCPGHRAAVRPAERAGAPPRARRLHHGADAGDLATVDSRDRPAPRHRRAGLAGGRGGPDGGDRPMGAAHRRPDRRRNLRLPAEPHAARIHRAVSGIALHRIADATGPVPRIGVARSVRGRRRAVRAARRAPRPGDTPPRPAHHRLLRRGTGGPAARAGGELSPGDRPRAGGHPAHRYARGSRRRREHRGRTAPPGPRADLIGSRFIDLLPPGERAAGEAVRQEAPRAARRGATGSTSRCRTASSSPST